MTQTKKTSSRDKAKTVLSYYWKIIRKYPGYMYGIVLAVPITIIINGFIPTIIVAGALKKLSTHPVQPDLLWHDFGATILLYFVVLLLGIVSWRLVDFFMWRLEIKAQQNIAEDVFAHLLSRSSDFHANHFGGSLVSQNNKLLTSYVRMADTTIFQVFPMIITIIATVILLLPKAPYFVLALIILTALYLMIIIFISEPVRRAAAKWGSAESRQTGLLADAITNVMSIKSYAHRQHEIRRFHGATQRTRELTFKFADQHRVQMNLFGIIGRTTQAVAFALAIVAVVLWRSDVSIMFLIVSYTNSIADHLFRFGNDSMRAYNRGFGDAYEMAKTLGELPEVLDPKTPEVSRIHNGAISFKDVTFTHNGSHKPLFKKLSLDIKPGEKIGLVGHSGSGKTTFTRLLMRFSDIDHGAIMIDGQNITHITQEDLHSGIAFVPQEPMLFHRTIAENIGYGNLSASNDEIANAAKLANATEFIKNLPDGLNTLVGERGIKLSGGQRQRIAIARAMLKDAPILVLDEATSALDSESEVLIQKALWRLMEGRTAIVIAHRLSTIQKMDRIIVLDEGTIVESGTHQELLTHGGGYAKLWAHQSGGFINE